MRGQAAKYLVMNVESMKEKKKAFALCHSLQTGLTLWHQKWPRDALWSLEVTLGKNGKWLQGALFCSVWKTFSNLSTEEKDSS